MVLISDKKYACETCIKGHRSSSCNHTERPLFEIKRKGRPVTQCQHCRELRKSKQVHVKCICGLKDGPNANAASSIESANASAVGMLPASIKISESTTLPAISSCSCDKSGVCNCCTSRKSPPRSKKKTSVALDSRTKTITEADYEYARKKDSRLKRILPKPSTPGNLISRIAGLRPLFPKSSKGRDVEGDTALAHPLGSHSHETGVTSPYHRAYERNREMSGEAEDLPYDGDVPTDISVWERPPSQASMYASSESASSSSYLQHGYIPSACGCGDACGCPGCAEHNLSDSRPTLTGTDTLASCSNPGACNACLDCGILSLPDHLPLDTPISEFDSYQTQSIDNWIRGVSLMPRPAEVELLGDPNQGWNGLLPADIVEAPTFFQPPIRCPVDCSCPPGNCQCGYEQVCGVTFSDANGMSFDSSEEDVSGLFNDIGRVDVAGVRSDSSRSPQYGEQVPSMFFQSAHSHRSPSSASSSSQSSFYSALSALGSVDRGWNSHPSSIGSDPHLTGIPHHSPYSDGVHSDGHSSISNFSSTSIQERFNGQF